MILSYANFGVQSAAYPDMTITDPKKKNKEYCIQYGRAYFWHYGNSGSRDFLNARISGRAKRAELYANGEQEVKAILKDENGQPDVSGSKVDLRKPLKILKKSLRAVDGKLKDQDFTATVTPIDATAQDEKLAYEAAMRVQMEHGEFMQRLGIPPPGGQTGPEVPVDEDELALHMDVKYRHHDAMLLEMKLNLALYRAGYEQTNRECLRDETTYGSSVIFMGLHGAMRLPRRINPGQGLFLPSDTENYNNLQAGAHIEKISLASLLKEVEADPDTTLSASEIEQLTTLARANMPGGNNYRNSYYDDSLGGKAEMAGQLEVMRFAFKSQDAVVMKEGVNKFGNKQVREKPAGYTGQTDAKGTVHRRTISSWYEGTLILGTDIGYGCRKMYEQMRDEENLFDCYCPYIVTSPDMLGGHSESVVEQCMTLVDEACAAWSRARFKLATMRGSWLEFDVDAIEAALEKDGSVTKSIAGFMRDGLILGRKQVAADEGHSPAPIVRSGELPFEKEVNMQFAVIERCLQQIEAITGINGSISAADPASRQGAGVTQLAIAGAENTLQYLYNAKETRFERVIRGLAVGIKQSEDRQPLTGPVPTSKGTYIVGTSDTLSKRVMSCRVERKPTEAQWNMFYETAKVALTQQQITLSDFSFLMAIDNLKQATAMLGIRAKRNQMNASKAAMEQTTMASQQQQESAKVKGQEDRDTMNLEYDRKEALKKLEIEGSIAVAQITAEGQINANEMLQFYKAQQTREQQGFQAEQNAQAADVKLAQTDAQLASGEMEAQAGREFQAQMQAQAPAAA